jgi:hypothetical protein
MPPNSQQALNDLKAFQGSRRKSQDILREQETQLGLPAAQQRQQGLRTAVQNTENLIRAVDPSVSGRTQGSLVTEAQKSRLIGMERAPLDDAFREQSRAFEGETNSLNELRTQALRSSQLALAEDDQKEQGMSGLYSTLYTREQDEIARQERERAFAEQQRQARAAQAQSDALARLLAGGGNSTMPTAPAADNRPSLASFYGNAVTAPSLKVLSSTAGNVLSPAARVQPQATFNPQVAGGGNLQGMAAILQGGKPLSGNIRVR